MCGAAQMDVVLMLHGGCVGEERSRWSVRLNGRKMWRSAAAVLIYNKPAVSAADTDCGRDTSTDFLYCATLTASSATNSKPLGPDGIWTGWRTFLILTGQENSDATAIIGTTLQHLSDCRYTTWRQVLWVFCLSRYPRGRWDQVPVCESTLENVQHPRGA